MSLALNLDPPLQDSLLKSILDLDQAVLDALPVGIYACDADGLILRVNRKAIELWGQTPRFGDSEQRFCGSFRLESLAGEAIPPEQTPMARAALAGETIEGAEAVVFNPDGRRWVGRVTVAPLRDDDGRVVGAVNCFQDVTTEHEMRAAVERQQRTFDLAMVASRMGTWRYTLADNICIYDDNAQKLYGLAEARFLHDEEGVKAKFHADDMDLMWSRVARALDPAGDGRYDVEYRVKQRDGSWKWLSAWGLVEFEGQGMERRPVAIAGASRDISERKQAEELNRLLANELHHRVKNTLATVQSIVEQTLRAAPDIDSARKHIDGRIIALARAHDLLTARSWASANLADLVARAIAPFDAARFAVAGPALDLSPRQALSLSLALHELATNAVKYGALSRAGGGVALSWDVQAGLLTLQWREAGGPPVVRPTRRGFGGQLLEDGLMHDLGGQTRLDYAAAGLRCSITATLGLN